MHTELAYSLLFRSSVISYADSRSNHQLLNTRQGSANHNDVIKWKHFPHYWPLVWGIRRSPVNSPHKGQWRRALIFSLIYAWINSWVNNRGSGDLRRHHAHYDVTVMMFQNNYLKQKNLLEPLFAGEVLVVPLSRTLPANPLEYFIYLFIYLFNYLFIHLFIISSWEREMFYWLQNGLYRLKLISKHMSQFLEAVWMEFS